MNEFEWTYDITATTQLTKDNAMVGQTVKIHPDSIFYGFSINNPNEVVGVIIQVLDRGYQPVRVEWYKNIRNVYPYNDLLIVG